MAAVNPRFGDHTSILAISFTPVEVISGGDLVERRTGGSRRVGRAAAGSLVVAGVALQDVAATRTDATVIAVDDEHGLTVVRHCVVPVVFAAAVTEGQKLIAAASGQLTPVPVASATYAAAEINNTRAIVGEAFDSYGAGAGLAYIS